MGGGWAGCGDGRVGQETVETGVHPLVVHPVWVGLAGLRLLNPSPCPPCLRLKWDEDPACATGRRAGRAGTGMPILGLVGFPENHTRVEGNSQPEGTTQDGIARIGQQWMITG